MTSSRRLTYGLVVLLVLAAALPASAGEVLFSIRDGRVTLVAHNALISDILAVWEKEGRTKIVARERVPGMVTSLEIDNEPESAALATILRQVTGYIAAKREVAPADASIYRCIVINPVPAPVLATKTAPSGRAMASPTPSIGYPPQSMGGDYGANPPTFVPATDDGDYSSGGAGRLPMAPGMRPPTLASPAGSIGQPPFNPYGGTMTPPETQRPTQPALTPTFPGLGTGLPGTVVPAPRPPGTPGQPVQKPPGSPDRKL
ncbi:MAG: hypothetical protein NTV05_14390 [Acidobacteria bacterium]|nr:hypothetical protein [Acidobacteriota bacterium]